MKTNEPTSIFMMVLERVIFALVPVIAILIYLTAGKTDPIIIYLQYSGIVLLLILLGVFKNRIHGVLLVILLLLKLGLIVHHVVETTTVSTTYVLYDNWSYRDGGKILDLCNKTKSKCISLPYTLFRETPSVMMQSKCTPIVQYANTNVLSFDKTRIEVLCRDDIFTFYRINKVKDDGITYINIR